MIRDQIIITGASRGIGREIARRVATECDRIALWATNRQKLEEVEKEISDRSKKVHIEVVDVSDAEQVKKAITNSAEALGGICSVVNNAGVALPGPFDEVSIADWDRLFNINMRSVFLVTHYSLPYIRKSGGGCYVNIASEVGRLNQANNVIYGASKFAVVGFSQGLALELAPEGIRVNAVAPGPVETDMWDGAVKTRSVAEGKSKEQFRQDILNRIPLGRFPTTKDIAESVAFLLDDEKSAAIIGNTLLVTCGLTVY